MFIRFQIIQVCVTLERLQFKCNQSRDTIVNNATAVTISIVFCVIVVFASTVDSGSFSVTMSLSNICLSFFSFVCYYIFRGWWCAFISVKVGDLLFGGSFIFDIIVNSFVRIGQLASWLVVGNHSRIYSTLTPQRNILKFCFLDYVCRIHNLY